MKTKTRTKKAKVKIVKNSEIGHYVDFISTEQMLHYFNELCHFHNASGVKCLNEGTNTMYFHNEEGVSLMEEIILEAN